MSCAFSKLKKWHYNVLKGTHSGLLWGSACYQTDDIRVLRACLAYMLRHLTKGYMPEPQLVYDILEGKSKVPPCGYIECFMNDKDHIH